MHARWATICVCCCGLDEGGVFTGIVQDIGHIQRRDLRAGDVRLTIGVDRLDLARTAVGDSICVQGVV